MAPPTATANGNTGSGYCGMLLSIMIWLLLIKCQHLVILIFSGLTSLH